MTWLQAMLLAVLQGASELFPISSLGHTVLVPALLHWNFDRRDPTFLSFVVALHLGTALALIAFYWADWVRIVRALVAGVVRGEISSDPDERIAWLLVIGTVPVALLGVFLEKPVRAFFGSTALVSMFLICNAFVMFAGEALKRRATRAERVSDIPLPRLAWSGGVTSGHLALGLVDRRGALAAARSRGCGSLFVPARDAGDLRRLGARNSEVICAKRIGRARSGSRRRRRRGGDRVCVRRVSDTLVRLA